MPAVTANIEALEKQKIGKLIADYSVPAIIGMLVMASYNIVDRVFVGRGVGTIAISAIAITFPINIVVMGFAQLVGMGSTALVSIKLGEKKKEEAERIIENGFLMALCISVSLSLLIFLTMDSLVTLLGGVGAAHRYATQFLSIMILGIPLQFITFALNGVIRAQGSPRIALVTILISGILNMILNPICIMVLHLGIRGSATATVVSQCVGATWVVIYFSGRWSYLKLRRISFDQQVISRIAMIGVSPLIMQVAGSFIMFVFNKTLYTYGGNLAIAAMGIGMSLMMVVMMPIYGLNQGIQPIIGFNYGAKHIDRVMETLSKRDPHRDHGVCGWIPGSHVLQRGHRWDVQRGRQTVHCSWGTRDENCRAHASFEWLSSGELGLLPGGRKAKAGDDSHHDETNPVRHPPCGHSSQILRVGWRVDRNADCRFPCGLPGRRAALRRGTEAQGVENEFQDGAE